MHIVYVKQKVRVLATVYSIIKGLHPQNFPNRCWLPVVVYRLHRKSKFPPTLSILPFGMFSVALCKQDVYSGDMITSFANKETEKIFRGERSRLLPPDIQKRALMRLDRINSAVTVDDVMFPPSHHLERLSGNREGQWSIRINDQWRVCFGFSNGAAHDVEIVDYH